MQSERGYLGMFDLRGIQEYIFRSNRIKSIIGASRILEGLFERGAKYAFGRIQKGMGVDKGALLLDWKGKAFRFLTDEGVQAEVVSVGGGNMLAAFRTKEIARAFADGLTRFALRETYSIGVASAFTPITGDYREDYARLKDAMARVKAENASMRPEASAPFTLNETGTGLPVTCRLTTPDERVSTETRLKREAYDAFMKLRFKKDGDDDDKVKTLTDALADSIENKSFVALVHIDGNSIGRQIVERLTAVGSDYEKAVGALREMSANLYEAFCVSAWGKMVEETDVYGYRPLITAGDDITFLCPAANAMAMVRAFLKEVEAHALFAGGAHLSACAGVCYVHSHFPLRRAYDMTEALCASAKRADKPEESRVDFHIIRSGLTGDLSAIRKAEFDKLLRRPFTLTELDKVQTTLDRLQKIPSSWRKAMRNAYHLAETTEATDVFARALSRGYDMGKAWGTDGGATIYDALELMDMTALDDNPKGGEQEGGAE